MRERVQGYYATRIYLPLSGFGRRIRGALRRVRGKANHFAQETRLPQVAWRECTDRRAIRIWEASKDAGNVRISELASLAALASACRDSSVLFEIGTFDGRTTLNLALNSPAGCRVHTLDLPRDLAPRFGMEEGEGNLVNKARPGARLERNRARHPDAVAKVEQHLGDSAVFDFSPWYGRCSLVFVDGSHEYHCVLSDSRAALQMLEPGGVALWHDYGIWPGVTRALEEIAVGDAPGLRHIRGTTLVFWRRPCDRP